LFKFIKTKDITVLDEKDIVLDGSETIEINDFIKQIIKLEGLTNDKNKKLFTKFKPLSLSRLM